MTSIVYAFAEPSPVDMNDITCDNTFSKCGLMIDEILYVLSLRIMKSCRFLMG